MPEQTTQSTDQNATPPQGEMPSNWDDALKGLPEPLQNLYNTHVSGLQNTVRATRQERDDLAKQIKDLLPKVEKGSELETRLTEFSSKLEAAERRAAFVEDAVKPEIGCRNPKAAYALAQAENLFTRNGSPDWNAIKAAAPELFGGRSVEANAGAGTGGTPPKPDMNTWIRTAAGRR